MFKFKDIKFITSTYVSLIYNTPLVTVIMTYDRIVRWSNNFNIFKFEHRYNDIHVRPIYKNIKACTIRY